MSNEADNLIGQFSLAGLAFLAGVSFMEIKAAELKRTCPDNGRLLTTWLDASGNATKCTYLPPLRRKK